MEDLFRHLNDRNQLWGQFSLTERNIIDVSEISRCPSTGLQATVHRTIASDDLDQWLRDGTTRTTAGQRSSVFRMVWVEHSPADRRDNIDADSLQRIIDAFGLNLAKGYYSTAFAGAASLPPCQVLNTEIRSYSFSYHPKFAIIWSRHVTANLTQGVCFASQPQISNFRQLLDIKWQLTDQEMMVAFLCSVLLSSEIDRDQNLVKQEVREVEVRTGYHRWASRNEQAASGDLTVLSAKMSGCATKMASCSRKIKVVQELNEFIVEQLQKLRHSQPVSPSDAGAGSQMSSNHVSDQSSKRLLEDNVSLIQKRAKLQQIDTDFFQSRITIQLNAVRHSFSFYVHQSSEFFCTPVRTKQANDSMINAQLFNLITQNDALVHYEVAKDSKLVAIASQRDSSSMKTLAVVTMVFLPGTFIASLFSIPFLYWNPGFGIYWATTLPLTLLTFAVWGAWTTKQHVKYMKENSKAKAELEGRLAVSEVGALVVRRRRTGTGMGSIIMEEQRSHIAAAST